MTQVIIGGSVALVLWVPLVLWSIICAFRGWHEPPPTPANPLKTLIVVIAATVLALVTISLIPLVLASWFVATIAVLMVNGMLVRLGRRSWAHRHPGQEPPVFAENSLVHVWRWARTVTRL